ncbi:MAG TPA: alcohol dehydrogenase catalytic domain-containing protein [Ilumatobacter sp.]|nr:alcohol dehydrogenase catalytic domain-containing protein [Ilumatobacter sp.]
MTATSIRAAVCRAFGEPLTIEELQLAAPGPGELRVRLAAVAICHSDVSGVDGAWGGGLPIVYGHEAAGVVAEVGSGVAFHVGQSVVVTLIRSCGDCRRCKRGEFVACTTTFALDQRSPLTTHDGETILHGLRTAAFAEQVVVHASQVVAVDDAIDPKAASLLACGVITGVGAVVNTAAVELGSTVVVIGCGGVGLNVVQGARLAGAGAIVAVDVQPAKLELARRLGATDVAVAGVDDVAAVVRSVSDEAMADYVFVATGSPAALGGALGLVGSMGALVVVGMPPEGVSGSYDPGWLAGLNQRILGSKMGTSVIARDIPALLGRYRAGELELDGLISRTFTLDQINEAMDEVRAGSALRNVIVFNDT